MGMEFASKFIGALVVNSQLFKLVKGVLSVAGPTNTQKDGAESHNFCINEFAKVRPESACCHCAASNCCPGLVSSQLDLEVVLCQPIITPYVHVNQAYSPSAFAKNCGDHSSSNIVVLPIPLRRFLLAILWHSVTIFDMVECLHPGRM
eukprot:1154823-Pelagomonas_calceolata.AAC.2